MESNGNTQAATEVASEPVFSQQTASGEMGSSAEPPVLHVLVVGFHHKKGCLVEYAYPPLLPEGRVAMMTLYATL
jgi:hypothetical protein